MKLIISQPMRGKTEKQIRNEREELVKKLQEEGHEVVDTIFSDFGEGKSTPLHYIAKSIEFMAEIDGVVFMQGWDMARGCIIEHECATRYNKFIKYL